MKFLRGVLPFLALLSWPALSLGVSGDRPELSFEPDFEVLVSEGLAPEEAPPALADVLTPEADDRFADLAEDPYLPLDTDHGVWVRFFAPAPSPDLWIFRAGFANLRLICVYWPRQHGVEEVCTGTSRAYASRPSAHHEFYFPRPNDLLNNERVYAYLESDFMTAIPLRWITERDYYRNYRGTHLFLSLTYGVLVALAVYNFFVFLGTRSPAFLLYSLHVASSGVALFGLEGLAYEYADRVRMVIPALSSAIFGLATIFLMFFVRYFLRTFEGMPRIDRGLVWLVPVAASGSALVFYDIEFGLRFYSLATFGFIILAMAASYYRLREGFRPAWYFLFAQLPYALLLVPASLASLGVIEMPPFEYSQIRLAIVFSAFCISFGLAVRINLLRDERERLIPELEARNAEMERFVYTVSHDLRSPIITIRGFLRLLEKDVAAQDFERMKTGTAEINTAVDRMYRFLDELLEFSRLGRFLDTPEEIDLKVLVDEAAALVAGRLSEKKITVTVAEDLAVVRGDRTRLREVFQNLIDNAAKYMGKREDPKIEIGRERRGRQDVFFVRDNGMGIAPEDQAKIFDLFVRLDHGEEGTGVGLTLVKRIVEAHGGRIWAESRGHMAGTVFYFTLPGSVIPTKA